MSLCELVLTGEIYEQVLQLHKDIYGELIHGNKEELREALEDSLGVHRV